MHCVTALLRKQSAIIYP